MTGTLSKQSRPTAQRDPLRRVGRAVLAIAIGILLCIMPNAGSEQLIVKEYITYKEYAFIALGNNKAEYKCLSVLYGKESAWNPAAKSGSHYGIPQGKSIYLSTLNGYDQIQWGLAYIGHRYGTVCKALDHFYRKGWH